MPTAFVTGAYDAVDGGHLARYLLDPKGNVNIWTATLR